MPNKTAKPHHHGDLREALIKSGIQLLNEGGMNSLTLRKCAAAAGVSHAAPAHHFSGLQGLVAAIVDRGMAMFACAMQKKIDQADNEPMARLLAMCEGYLGFAIENEGLAYLMFNQKSDFIEKKVPGRNASVAFNILVDSCAPFKDGPKGPLVTQYAVWSLIQGYTHLFQMSQIKVDQACPTVDFSDLLAMLNLEETSAYRC